MKLIECPKTGERCLVENLEGYDGWVVLSEDASPPPSAHCDWCCERGQWIEDEEAKAFAEKRAKVRDPDALLAIIDGLTARVAALEATIIAN